MLLELKSNRGGITSGFIHADVKEGENILSKFQDLFKEGKSVKTK